jgi:tetratricopeptide (TPR) repeat protein
MPSDADRARSLGEEGVLRYKQGELDIAMRLFLEKERICRSLADWDGIQSALGCQAMICRDRGEVDRALGLHGEEARICRTHGFRNGLRLSLTNTWEIHAQRGDLRTTEEELRELIDICQELRDEKGLAEALSNLAFLFAKQDRRRDAIPLAQEAQRLALRHNMERLLQHVEKLVSVQGLDLIETGDNRR